jgi:hypothetical protein
MKKYRVCVISGIVFGMLSPSFLFSSDFSSRYHRKINQISESNTPSSPSSPSASLDSLSTEKASLAPAQPPHCSCHCFFALKSSLKKNNFGIQLKFVYKSGVRAVQVLSLSSNCSVERLPKNRSIVKIDGVDLTPLSRDKIRAMVQNETKKETLTLEFECTPAYHKRVDAIRKQKKLSNTKEQEIERIRARLYLERARKWRWWL